MAGALGEEHVLHSASVVDPEGVTDLKKKKASSAPHGCILSKLMEMWNGGKGRGAMKSLMAKSLSLAAASVQN